MQFRPGFYTNGATKIVNNIMLMVNDMNRICGYVLVNYVHEIGHIINGDFGISFEKRRNRRAGGFICL